MPSPSRFSPLSNLNIYSGRALVLGLLLLQYENPHGHRFCSVDESSFANYALDIHRRLKKAEQSPHTNPSPHGIEHTHISHDSTTHGLHSVSVLKHAIICAFVCFIKEVTSKDQTHPRRRPVPVTARSLHILCDVLQCGQGLQAKANRSIATSGIPSIHSGSRFASAASTARPPTKASSISFSSVLPLWKCNQ